MNGELMLRNWIVTMSSTSNAENLADAIEQMREKYRVEREKRLRPDGSDQFIEVKDKFSYFGKDPVRKRRG